MSRNGNSHISADIRLSWWFIIDVNSFLRLLHHVDMLPTFHRYMLSPPSRSKWLGWGLCIYRFWSRRTTEGRGGGCCLIQANMHRTQKNTKNSPFKAHSSLQHSPLGVLWVKTCIYMNTYMPCSLQPLNMEAVYTSKTLATLPTSTGCKDPRTEYQ